MKNKNITVLYIAGNGHSGSTLLDMIIGTSPDIFSAGELTFITRSSIFEEYCSCNERIVDCTVWSKIVQIWLDSSPINLEDYQRLRLKFERNKTTFRTLYAMVLPDKDFKVYCLTTRLLFEAIYEVTGKNIIVDSSKSPQRIAVLKRIVNLKVIHLCRNAKGVLNSAKNSSKKDLKAGREVDLPPNGTAKTLLDWIFVNFITQIFTIGVNSKKIQFKNYIRHTRDLMSLHDKIEISNSTKGFSTDHMLAGNLIRLKKNLKIDRNIGVQYSRLNPKQYKIAAIVDFIFPFWS